PYARRPYVVPRASCFVSRSVRSGGSGRGRGAGKLPACAAVPKRLEFSGAYGRGGRQAPGRNTEDTPKYKWVARFPLAPRSGERVPERSVGEGKQERGRVWPSVQMNARSPDHLAPFGGRVAEVTPSARSRPDLMCSIEVESVSNIACTSPASSPVSDCGEPRYGTCTMLTPVICMNSSPYKCCGVPVPDEPMLILPGFAL